MTLTKAAPEWGTFEVLHDGAFRAGMRTSIRFRYVAGTAGVPTGSHLRVGIPNTGWEEPVVPQQRYWDELVNGRERRLAPFHPVNTTADVRSAKGAGHLLEVMERMLVPDEDPAVAYWRWWITLTVEGADLDPGDEIEILYGDRRFGAEGVRIQTFVEPGINVTAYLDPGGTGTYMELQNSPVYFDVTAGEGVRANLVLPSIRPDDRGKARVSITDECHCAPASKTPRTLCIDSVPAVCEPGAASVVELNFRGAGPAVVRAMAPDGGIWGQSNPSVRKGPDGLSLFWGDLHAQSEHHVMHSQRKDFRQEGWSKGISCGTLDECYAYAREVSLLDFVAITDQGACLTSRWEYCQEKVREYHRDGEFAVFKGYEAGSPLGHRNVIYRSSDIDAPLDARRFNSFHPEILFEHYRGRKDVIIIPHHVKTWTDWSYHDPALEPLMEIYSCWGQSESPGVDLWNKGQTPGAGAWEALRRGYRLGMIASSDNHVGMPGRSFPGDRQIHTPFKGGLCAVWSEDLTRESLFTALRRRHCYGTTGDRIILRFAIGGRPMGSLLAAGQEETELSLEVHGTDALDRVEIVRNLEVWRILRPERPECSMQHTETLPPGRQGCYYVRVYQKNNERAWSSPIWLDAAEPDGGV